MVFCLFFAECEPVPAGVDFFLRFNDNQALSQRPTRNDCHSASV